MRKVKTGIVLSNKMQKTVVVGIDRRIKQKGFHKYIKRVSKIKAHDETNQCKIGDQVEITETRPISKDKTWCVTKIVNQKAA